MAPQAAAEESQKKRKEGGLIDQRVLLIGVAAIVISAVAALLVALFVVKNSSSIAAGRQPEAVARTSSEIGPLFEAGEYTTNLAPGGEKKFIKVKVVFELSDKSLEKEISEKLPVLQDRILYFLNSKTSEELSVENRAAFKREILNDLNRYLTKGKIKNIYFSDLVMQ
ncbi:MAG: flagellar basal body-associated FliL family protein [Thermacetogeniaceae bacterium]